MSLRALLALFGVLLVASAAASRAPACSVPVFRYALERWEPDPFDVLVVHDRELTAEEREQVEGLHLAGGKVPANIAVRRLSVAAIPDELENVLEAERSGALPRIAVLTPPRWGPRRVLWSGALRDPEAMETFQKVLDSPARRKVVERLTSGDSAVWLCLETGDPEKDSAAFGFLEKHLAKLEKELELPEGFNPAAGAAGLDPDSEVRFESVPIRIAFSTLRVSRTDTAEKHLVEQLLSTEADLVEERDKPMAFPVFGRGRALWAYIGAGINEDTITDAARFLVGACSCIVKEQNPGADLLIAADWEAALTERVASREIELPPLSGLEGFAADAPVESPGPESDATEKGTSEATAGADAPVESPGPESDATEKGTSEPTVAVHAEAALLEGPEPDEPQPASASEAPERVAPATDSAPAAPPADREVDPRRGTVWRNLLVAGSALLVLIAGATAVFLRRAP